MVEASYCTEHLKAIVCPANDEEKKYKKMVEIRNEDAIRFPLFAMPDETDATLRKIETHCIHAEYNTIP